MRKPICPTPTPWSLSDQSGGLVPPRLKGRGFAALLDKIESGDPLTNYA